MRDLLARLILLLALGATMGGGCLVAGLRIARAQPLGEVPWFNVKDFGCKADSATDDTACITAAINAACGVVGTAAATRGGIVYFPRGGYVHTGISMNCLGLSLRGPSAAGSNRVVDLRLNSTTASNITITAACDDCSVEGLTLKVHSGTPGSSQIGIEVQSGASGTNLMNLLFPSGSNYTAIKLNGDGRTTIRDVVALINVTSGYGIYSVDSVSLVIEHVTISNAVTCSAVIKIEQTGSNQPDSILMNHVGAGTGGSDCPALQVMAADSTKAPRWVMIENSQFEAGTTSAVSPTIDLQNVKDFRCTNCYVIQGKNSVKVTGGPGPIVFVNSIIGLAQEDGFLHDADVPTSLTDCTVSDGSQATTNTDSGLLLTANSRQMRVIGGRYSGDLITSGGANQKYGIEGAAGAAEYEIAHIACADNGTGCSTGVTISGLDVTALGAVCDGTTDDKAALRNALLSCGASGGRIRLPRGSCLVSNAQLLLDDVSYCTIEGDGRGASTILLSGASGQIIANSGTSTGVMFRDLTIKSGTATVTAVSINGRYVQRITFDNVAFDLSSGGFGIVAQGAQGFRFINSECFGDGDNSDTNTARCIQFQRGSEGGLIANSRFEYTYQGFTFDSGTAGEEPSQALRVIGNEFLGGWWLQDILFADSGSDVSYTATVLTDSDAAFGTLGANTDVRILAVKESGTVTNVAVSGTRLEDSTATFSTAAVAAYDLVKTATAFATVRSVQSETILWVDEWRSLTTFRPVSAPASGIAYTAYGLKLGRRSSNTATTITVARWYDVTGATATTPSAETLYEVMTPHSDYQGVHLEEGVNNVIVEGNVFRSSWADQVSIFGGKGNKVVGNDIADGQDYGITMNGQYNVAEANTINHQGTGGIFVSADDSVVANNVIRNTTWTSNVTTLSGIQVRGADRTRIAGNTIDRGTSSSQPYGIYVDDLTADTTDSAVIEGNQTIASTTAGLRLQDADAANIKLGYNQWDTVISDGGGLAPLVNGLPLTNSPNTCAADRDGDEYWDLSLNEPCTCNSTHSSGARWCQADGGGCTSTTSCG